MPDRLYLSCWIKGFDETNMLRHFGKMLEIFPFSKLARRGPLLRVYAIELAEPSLLEREFPSAAEPGAILEAAREFAKADCTCQVETFWDLWQHNQEWKLEPASITLACFGPRFENEHGGSSSASTRAFYRSRKFQAARAWSNRISAACCTS